MRPVILLSRLTNKIVITLGIWRHMKTPLKIDYYNEVSLHRVVRHAQLHGAGFAQADTVDNLVAGHEIVVIVGSPSKVAKASLIELATKLTEHTRVNQGWSGVHVIVEPIEIPELPPLGEPRHVEGNFIAWIV